MIIESLLAVTRSPKTAARSLILLWRRHTNIDIRAHRVRSGRSYHEPTRTVWTSSCFCRQETRSATLPPNAVWQTLAFV